MAKDEVSLEVTPRGKPARRFRSQYYSVRKVVRQCQTWNKIAGHA
jgi:hypothetical protein